MLTVDLNIEWILHCKLRYSSDKHDNNSIKFQFIHKNTFTEFKVMGNFHTFDQLPHYKNKINLLQQIK